MQFDPTRPIPSSSSSTATLPSNPNPHFGIKRSFSQQATSPTLQNASPSSSKVPRVATSVTSSEFPASRRSTSSARMPPLPHNQSARSGKASSFGSRAHNMSGHSSSRYTSSAKRGGGKSHGAPRKPPFEGPVHNESYIIQQHQKSLIPLKKSQESAPKSSLGNFCMIALGKPPQYTSVEGVVEHDNQRIQVWRTTVVIDMEPPITGIGDSPEKKQSESLAALSAVYQLQELGVLDHPRKLKPEAHPETEVKLSDGSIVTYERARSFMDYYCRRYNFGKPDITFRQIQQNTSKAWEAVMTVNDSRIGLGAGMNKKVAQVTCYLDVTKYLEKCDADLWKSYTEASRSGADLGLAPKVRLQISDELDDAIRDLCVDIRKSRLYRNRPAQNRSLGGHAGPAASQRYVPPRTHREGLDEKSRRLLAQRNAYLADDKMKKMRETRMALPVYSRFDDVITRIRDSDVTICMAATGSGKTTQIPQMILDDYIQRGEGAKCNVVCTQPRRLAAISVADRVSKERGEPLGGCIGYQVRFEHKLPEDNGSVTFCTVGVFLKRLQSALSGVEHPGNRSLDDVTHIVVDEVHERDVDTDLLLVVLKRLLADRKARKKPLKIILMSATIDPTLFQHYFLDENGGPAPVIEIPGRTFPVTKYYLDEFLPELVSGPSRWILDQEPVAKHLYKELGAAAASSLGIRLNKPPETEEDLILPYSLIAATIAHVLQSSSDGHVLVFLPGWDDIVATQRALEQPFGPLPVNITNRNKFSVHLLHSTIPLAEQQVVFDPPLPGIRRIILATNIAETSITIPDVVYVVDTAKIKEIQYDPDRHMSSLVSAWVGSSNLNQRAGRAGRHRSGEYFGLLSSAHAATLHPHQTVEMKRVDLSNIVMHVKALNFPGMTVEEVLAATIEAPDPERVASAMKELQMVGALDAEHNLTSLGRVLLALPVEAQMGRLVLYGSFFRCLDQALTLAAILTNRDPFLSPMHLKTEAAAKKNSWTPDEFRSDALATLRAFNAWWALQSKGEYISANRFCVDNFLAKPTLLMIQKIKQHLLQALDHAGVLAVSAGGHAPRSDRYLSVPAELNANGDSLPLLAGLISIASQPKFAIRTGEKTLRTARDKVTFIHPSSVNHRKRDLVEQQGSQPLDEKQLYAFAEKRRNVSQGGSAQTYLITTTRLDPMTYMLFGAYNLQVTERGIECDNWLPIVGNLDALDDIQRLKTLMEACMLRVFEGITMGRKHLSGRGTSILPREEELELGDEEEDVGRDYSLSKEEVKELDLMTRDVVSILNRYRDERVATQSRSNSRPATPMASPHRLTSRLPGGSQSGYSTPNFLQSRPGTPSRLSRRF